MSYKCLQIEALMIPQIKQWFMDSRAIYDQALFYQRQIYFKTKEEGKIKTYNYVQLYDLVKTTDVWVKSTLDVPVKVYIIKQVIANWTGHIKATIAYKKSPKSFKTKPKMPNYLAKADKEFNLLQIDSSRLRNQDFKLNSFCLPKLKQFKIRMPKWIDLKSIKFVSVQPFYGKVKLNVVYKVEENKELNTHTLDKTSALGIDIGLNNLMAITINDKCLSYVVKGGPVKSMNQFYNKTYAEIKSSLEKLNHVKSSNRLVRLSLKRKHKLENYMHNASRRVIDLCTRENIGTIVIGHNQGWKQRCDIGKRNNQNFIQVPFNKLISMISYKAKEAGIEVKVVEESYTSKTDHLMFEEMKHQETYSGKRLKRGLFQSGTGKLINADINGAIGILRKGKEILDGQLMALQNRGDVVSPKVLMV